MFGFLLLVSCMCAAPGWVLNLSRRGEVASNFSESSGHRIDEFRAVGFRTRFEGSQSAHHLLHQISKPPEKVAADAVGKIQRLQAATATLGNSKGGQTSPGSRSRCSGTRLSASIQGACGFVQAFLDVPRSACSVRKRSSTELANRKFSMKQKSSRAKRGYTAWQRRSRHPQWCSHDALVFGARRISFCHWPKHKGRGWDEVLPVSKTSHRFRLMPRIQWCE